MNRRIAVRQKPDADAADKYDPIRCTADLRDADSGVGLAVDENVWPSLVEYVPTWPKAP